MKNNNIVTANRVIYQAEIFPDLKNNFGYLTNKHEQLIQMLDLLDLNEIYPRTIWDSCFGRPIKHRHAFVIAFIARTIFNIAKTKDLIDYLNVDRALRVICGFDGRSTSAVPSEASFSREFAQLCKLGIPDKIHQSLISTHCGTELYEHLSFDASSIEVAEKAHASDKKERTVKMQQTQTTAKILSDLPMKCNFGIKKNSNGKIYQWKGYKLHAVVNEYNVPITAVVTAASVHDSLCAIPLVRMTEGLVNGLYYLADKGYDAAAIRNEIRLFEKVPLIDFKRDRSGKTSGEFIGNQINRYKKRTYVESHFSQLKMNYLPRYILYRGIEKVRGFLNIALAVIAAAQIIKYA